MAEVKKKTEIKETKTKVEDKKTEEKTVVDKIIEKKEEKEILNDKKTIRKIDREEWIPVMSNIAGTFVFMHPSCRTQLEMTEYGTIDYIQYGDLLTMKASQGRILNEGWIIVLDEDVYKSLGLSKLYEKIITMDDVNKLYELSEAKIADIMRKAPRIVKENVCRRILQMRKTGEWDSIRKLRAVENAIGIKFDDLENTSAKYQK